MTPNAHAINNHIDRVVTNLRVTEDEYFMLGVMIIGVGVGDEMEDEIIEAGHRYIGPAQIESQVLVTKAQIKMLEMTYDQLPLYINSTYEVEKILSTWRLKIGR